MQNRAWSNIEKFLDVSEKCCSYLSRIESRFILGPSLRGGADDITSIARASALRSRIFRLTGFYKSLNTGLWNGFPVDIQDDRARAARSVSSGKTCHYG